MAVNGHAWHIDKPICSPRGERPLSYSEQPGGVNGVINDFKNIQYAYSLTCPRLQKSHTWHCGIMDADVRWMLHYFLSWQKKSQQPFTTDTVVTTGWGDSVHDNSVLLSWAILPLKKCSQITTDGSVMNSILVSPFPSFWEMLPAIVLITYYQPDWWKWHVWDMVVTNADTQIWKVISHYLNM